MQTKLIEPKEDENEISIEYLCSVIDERLKIEHDLVICLSGDEGYGKTTLGIEISRIYDKEFNLVRNVAYLPTTQETAEKFHSLKKNQAFLVDEAIKILYKLKWNDRLQILINEMYATERWQTKLSILCIPRFKDLNEQFRHHRVMIWIHIIERGVALIFIKDRYNFVATDPWYLDEIEKQIRTRRKVKRNLDIADLIDLCRRFDTFNGYILFNPLDKETQDIYDDLKADARERAKYLDAKEEPRKYLKQRNILLKFAHKFCFIKDQDAFREVKETDLAKLLKMTQPTISDAIKTVEENINIEEILKKEEKQTNT